MSAVTGNIELGYFTAETLRTQRFAESCGKLIDYAKCATFIGCATANNLLGRASFYIRRKTRLNFYKRNPEVERCETAWVSNKSEAVVFEDRKWSLDFLVRFASSQNERENNKARKL